MNKVLFWTSIIVVWPTPAPWWGPPVVPCCPPEEEQCRLPLLPLHIPDPDPPSRPALSRPLGPLRLLLLAGGALRAQQSDGNCQTLKFKLIFATIRVTFRLPKRLMFSPDPAPQCSPSPSDPSDPPPKSPLLKGPWPPPEYPLPP